MKVANLSARFHRALELLHEASDDVLGGALAAQAQAQEVAEELDLVIDQGIGYSEKSNVTNET